MTAPAQDAPLPSGVRGFLRRSTATPLDIGLTVVVALVVAAAALPIVRWALLDAVWSGTADDCRASGGACWAFVAHKLGFIGFGLYPPAERWRAAVATLPLSQ